MGRQWRRESSVARGLQGPKTALANRGPGSAPPPLVGHGLVKGTAQHVELLSVDPEFGQILSSFLFSFLSSSCWKFALLTNRRPGNISGCGCPSESSFFFSHSSDSIWSFCIHRPSRCILWTFPDAGLVRGPLVVSLIFSIFAFSSHRNIVLGQSINTWDASS